MPRKSAKTPASPPAEVTPAAVEGAMLDALAGDPSATQAIIDAAEAADEQGSSETPPAPPEDTATKASRGRRKRAAEKAAEAEGSSEAPKPAAKAKAAPKAKPAPTGRAGLTLGRPIVNELEGSTLVQAKRSPQVHVLPAGETITLCKINTAKWAEQVEVAEGTKVNCPLCASALKATAEVAVAEGAEGGEQA